MMKLFQIYVLMSSIIATNLKDTSEYEKFVAEMNETIKEELPKIGKNSSRDVFDFFEEKLNEKYRKDGFKYFRA